MKITIWDGREFDFEFACEEQDVKKMYMDELLDQRKNIVDERDGYEDMDDWGLVLDEALGMVDNEISERKQRPLKNNFLCDMVDEIDEWLISKGVRIPNEERDEEDPENESNFYAEDFDWIMEMMREHCRKNGIVVEDEWED